MNNYKENVLNVNKQLKVESKSLNGALKILTMFDSTPDKLKKQVRKILKDKIAYDSFKEQVRKSKKGNFSPFYCLQLLHKINEGRTELKETVKVKNVVAAKKAA